MAGAKQFTEVLRAVERGDRQAADQLLPLVYHELRKMASARLAFESPDNSLQATELVHEVWLRLVGADGDQDVRHFNGRRHFLAAAAAAMRRILVDAARRRRAAKRGGGRQREILDIDALAGRGPTVEIEALNEALTNLESVDAPAAQLVNLRYFAGLTLAEAAQVLEISHRSADRLWAFARSWLLVELDSG